MGVVIIHRCQKLLPNYCLFYREFLQHLTCQNYGINTILKDVFLEGGFNCINKIDCMICRIIYHSRKYHFHGSGFFKKILRKLRKP